MKESEKLIIEKRAEIRKIRFGTSGSTTKNVKQTRNLKREIAQAMTAINAAKKLPSQAK